MRYKLVSLSEAIYSIAVLKYFQLNEDNSEFFSFV